ADIDVNTLGNVAGQTFDSDLARDQFENSTIDLHPATLTSDVDRNGPSARVVQRNAVEVCMQEAVLDGINLQVFQDRIRRAGSGDVQLKNRVTSGFRTQHFLQRFWIHGNGNTPALSAVDNTRHQPLPAQPPRGILAAIIAAFSIHNNLSHKYFLLFSVGTTDRAAVGHIALHSNWA